MERRTADKNRANISSVEVFFDKLLRGTLTEHLFFDELPVSLNKEWKELVVVDCHNVLRDHEAFGKQTVLIMLYAMPSSYGVKNVKVIQELETKLTELVDNCDDPYYHISRRGCYSGYDGVNDIFYNIVQLNLIIT